MRSIATKLVILTLVLALPGCLLALVKVFEYDVLKELAVDSISVDVNQGTALKAIDLSDNATYDEHKDKIKLVDRIGFRATMENEGATGTTMSVYFDKKGPVDPVDLDEATLVLENFPVPVGTSRISYGQSEKLLKNFALFQKAVESGELRLLAISNGSVEFDFTDLVLVITFTVGR